MGGGGDFEFIEDGMQSFFQERNVSQTDATGSSLHTRTAAHAPQTLALGPASRPFVHQVACNRRAATVRLERLYIHDIHTSQTIYT